ncbi:class II histone deacetylase [Kumtagia ephedrae]|uniref:Class II histone deacetylase n=1 Tax=Kumtagia ephedrae TaxID=2116701 RepID=A0A2P7RZB3_9HYPH|nr:class II histone deacetylase [Mesorhizobium ephedrae]PSJ55554.1 class II histone deacetylase [Mesorhizobium ephedrae]
MSTSAPSERTAFYFDEKCLWFSAGPAALVLPVGGWVQPMASGGHADSPEPKRRLKSLMDVSGLTDRLDWRKAPAATREDLLRIHPASYIDAFKAMSDAGGGALHPTAPFSGGAFEIAQQSAGLAIQAVVDVADGSCRTAYAVTRPSGHHCSPDTSMGFCMFANVALAVEAARARHGLKRIAVLDWDVHHGNGTEACFYGRGDVLTISIHQEHCFPPGASGGASDAGAGDGAGANINIPLWPGSGHDMYLAAMEGIALPAIREFRPDLIVVVSGFDANGVDPLARMLATSETFRTMTRLVRQAATELCGGRLVIVQEGGYAETAVPFCGVAVLEELAGVSTGVVDPYLGLVSLQQPSAAFNAAQLAVLKQHPRYSAVPGEAAPAS